MHEEVRTRDRQPEPVAVRVYPLTQLSNVLESDLDLRFLGRGASAITSPSDRRDAAARSAPAAATAGERNHGAEDNQRRPQPRFVVLRGG